MYTVCAGRFIYQIIIPLNSGFHQIKIWFSSTCSPFEKDRN